MLEGASRQVATPELVHFQQQLPTQLQWLGHVASASWMPKVAFRNSGKDPTQGLRRSKASSEL